MSDDEEYTLRSLDEALKNTLLPMIESHSGKVFKTTGDGLLAEFPTARDAVDSATEIQDHMNEENRMVPDSLRLDFRIGIHYQSVMRHEEDLFGNGVNIAARAESSGTPGGVTVTAAAFRQLEPEVQDKFTDRGYSSLKNIAAPVRLLEYHPDAASTDQVIDMSQIDIERDHLFDHAYYLVTTKIGNARWFSQGLQEATELIAGYPDAPHGFAVRAIGHALRVWAGIATDSEMEKTEAADATESALALGQDFSPSYAALVALSICIGDHETGYKNAMESLERWPSNPDLLWLSGASAMQMGKLSESRELLLRAVEARSSEYKNPIRNLLGFVHFVLGDARSAISIWEENTANGGPIHSIPAFWCAAYQQISSPDKADAAKKLLYRMIPDYLISRHGMFLIRALPKIDQERVIELLRNAGFEE